MKKKIYLLITFLLLLVGFLVNDSFKEDIVSNEVLELKKKHKQYLENSPFKTDRNYSKKERVEKGLPPNKYLEREWELTMNPQTGRPTSENLEKIQKQLKEKNSSLFARIPGDKSDNNWVERGPNNVGGRVRALMFDPNDNSNETVFAAGVSGGLWKNTNISSSTSSWTRVNISENLNITSIAYDPNSTNVFYAGTGESYVNGDVNGNGLWKSIDGGATWDRILGGPTANGEGAKLIVNSPGSIAGDYTATQAGFGSPLTEITGNLVLADDGIATTSDACTALVNGAMINGNIALIDRGSCSFDDKVKAAENAGAVAVIVVNNNADPIFVMGGDDFTIYIPAIMISQADGVALKAELGNTVNVTIQPDVTPSTANFSSGGIQHINDVVVRDIGSTSEIYVAASASLYTDANPIGFFGTGAYGLYKSTDNGLSWTLLTIPANGANSAPEPNDIEIASDNKVWVSTTRSLVSPGDPGGQVFSSSDGTTFTLQKTIPDGRRTQISVSASNADVVYVLAEVNTLNAMATDIIAPFLYMSKTTDGFTNETTLSLPSDVDTGISADDFTRGQAFYDLVIKVDPTDDSHVFVGGIDLFESTDSGTSWSQLSKWSNNNNLSTLIEPLVHADHHAIAFGNGDVTKMLFGNDGGVYYSSDSGVNIGTRNKDFNVTQFYTVGVAPTSAITGDYFYAGAQDNGTQFFENSSAGIDSSIENPTGGDGAATLVDQDGTDTYFIYNFVYNNSITKREYPSGNETTINDEDLNKGDFINQAELDSNLNILYTNYSEGSTYEVRRYDFSGPGSVDKTVLSDALMDSNPTALKVLPSTGTSTTLVIGLDTGKLLKVTGANGGSSVWSDIGDSNFIGSISDIEFGANEFEIFVTMHNYGVKSIWYKKDAVTGWVSKEGNLPDLPVKAILRNPLNTEEVLVGTELGVWFTNDFSSTDPTWDSAFNGMSNVKVTDLDLRDDNTVFASTYGRGVFSGTLSSSTLSINENEIESQIKIFPTVSNGDFKITAQNEIRQGSLSVFDLNGREVYTSKIDFNKNSIQDISINTSSGMYIVKFKSDNKQFTHKIIIE